MSVIEEAALSVFRPAAGTQEALPIPENMTIQLRLGCVAIYITRVDE